VTASTVTIIATGVANTASIAAAFRRCGAQAVLTDNPDIVETADRVVLPGVGSFAAGIRRLRDRGLAEVIARRFREDRPLLAVCLGLQLLCARSDEAPGVAGLGVIDSEVRRFPKGARTPHFGWNTVEVSANSRVINPGYAYYAHSYRITEPPPGWEVATTLHGAPFVAALERGSVCACQFHPELSGAWGQSLLQRWLTSGGADTPC
jgi:imidazole glycerol phosphate synthase glutamine amidotransferase subunit